jgi:alpha-aminoadipate carrier protein LysW
MAFDRLLDWAAALPTKSIGLGEESWTMPDVNCPECGAAIGVGTDTIEGEILPCPECGVELEVTSLEPCQLAPAPKEEEDWGE